MNSVYVESVSPSLPAIQCNGCTYTNGKIHWEGNLYSKKSQFFSYYLKAKEQGTYIVNASLTYNNNKNITQAKNIVIETTQLLMNETYPLKEILLGDAMNISVNFKNKDTDFNITNVKYKLYIPKTTAVLEKSQHFVKKGDYYIYEMATFENITDIYIKIAPEEIGLHEFKSTVDYKINNQNYELSSYNKLEVKLKPLILVVKKSSVYNPGQQIEIPVIIKNINPKNYQNINILVDTDTPWGHRETLVSTLPAWSEDQPVIISFKAPATPPLNYNINISVSYQTQFKEILKEEKLVTISFSSENTAKGEEGSNEGESDKVEVTEVPNDQVEPARRNDDVRPWGFLERVSNSVRASIRKPLWIVIGISAITLAIVIILIIKRTKQEALEDTSDSRSE